MMQTIRSALRFLSREATLISAVAFGSALRLDQIRGQIILEDEWNALHVILQHGYGYCLTHLGRFDYCIPLAVYYKFIAGTIGLSEMWMRAPVLLAGIGSIVIWPLLLRGFVSRGASDGFAWLLAVSPLHVYFSRLARPYSVAMLLVFLAGLAFLAWWRTGSRRWKWIYAFCAILAPYFHLTALLPSLVPMILALIELPWRRIRKEKAHRSPSATLRLSLWIALGLFLTVGIPMVVDRAKLAHKTGRGYPDWATITGAWELLVGTHWRSLWIALASLAVMGLIVAIRRHPRLSLFLGVQAAVAPLLVLATRPVLSEWPMIFARYCCIGLPFLLLMIALGLSSLIERAGRLPPCLCGVIYAFTASALFFAGPLPKIHAHPNNWTNHLVFQYSYGRARLDYRCEGKIPEFYLQLAQEPPGSVKILEAPWWYYGTESVPLPCYQRVHRQHVSIGFVEGPDGAMSEGGLPRLGELPVLTKKHSFVFRNFIHVSDQAKIQRRGIRYVVFHRKIDEEMARLLGNLHIDVSRWIQDYRLLYGRAVYKDRWLVVFDVRRTKH
jgi:hypothetical protein